METTLGKPTMIARSALKTDTIVYWILTGLFCLQMTFTAYAQLRLPQVAQAFTHLGFPDYFRIELSWAKLLGVGLLLAPVPPRLKEWAYAGFAFDLGSALIAHLSMGDPPAAWGWAAATGLLWALSYVFWRRLQAKQVAGVGPQMKGLVGAPKAALSHPHGGEVGLADQAVDAFDVVDDLGDDEVGGGAEVGIGDVRRDVVHLSQDPQRLTHRQTKRFVQVAVQPDGDPVFGGLGERPLQRPQQRPTLRGGQQRDPQGGPQRGFQRGQGDLAVALRIVGVAHEQPGVGDLDRQVQRRAGDEIAQVQVAAERAGGHRVQRLVAGWRDPDDSQEWCQRKPERPTAPGRKRALALVDRTEQRHRPGLRRDPASRRAAPRVRAGSK